MEVPGKGHPPSPRTGGENQKTTGPDEIEAVVA